MTLGLGLHPGISHADYHADPSALPSLSCSIAKVLLARSPAHAWLEHPRLGGGGEDKPTAESDRGSVVHDLLLGGGAGYVSVDAEDWRTKAAREAREAIRADGKVPILGRVLAACEETARNLRQAHGFAYKATEVTAIWESGGVACRGRLDAWDEGAGLILDLKTCDDAMVSGSSTNMYRMGLDIQHAAYVEAIETLFPARAGRIAFHFLFAEIGSPYGVRIVEPAGSMRDLGRKRWARAKETWRRCLEAKEWPGYPLDVEYVEAPAWAVTDEMMRGEGPDGF